MQDEEEEVKKLEQEKQEEVNKLISGKDGGKGGGSGEVQAGRGER